MDLLLIGSVGNSQGKKSQGDKSHYVYIKDFISFLYNKTNHKEKNHFCENCIQCFSSEELLTNHKKVCLEINGK